ncbi:hypothetical protein [Fusibacter bizertensis]
MSMNIPIELKTGFFQLEQGLIKIDNHAQKVKIEISSHNDMISIDFDTIHRVIYNPHLKHELEIQTTLENFIGYLKKESIQRGVIDFLKIEFGDKFKEII